MSRFFDLLITILAAPGHWVLGSVRYYCRQPELPAGTVNLDETEAGWNTEAKDEWDIAFQAETHFLPAFSRLEAERLNGLSSAQAESELRRRQIQERDRSKREVEASVGVGTVGFGIYTVCDAVITGNVINRELGTPIYASYQSRLEQTAPNPYLPPLSVDVKRYHELMLEKGIDWRPE